MTYTIKQIADLAGVTTRTLRYYDEIGLLSPYETGDNGYRYYDQSSLLCLQQILFFRELDVPLKEIQAMMSSPDFDLVQSLEEHRRSLEARAERLLTLIETVDETIATIQGEWIMSDKEYFEGFDETQYEEEVKQRWGYTPQYAESQKKWGNYTNTQKQQIKEMMGDIHVRMVGTAGMSPDDPSVQQAVAEFHKFLNESFYTCDAEFMRNLSNMWVEDPRFAANYENIREGGAVFVREAVHIWADTQK
jgi:DNA-binding transcriptional MerR regulator